MTVPGKQKALVYLIAGLLYLLWPADLSPDFIPLVGWIDDILVTGTAIYLALGALKTQVSSGPRRGPRRAKPAEPAAVEEEDPLDLLGLKPGASLEEIKQAHRKAMAQYHPDKVAHLGRELRALADKKAKAIQKAYRELSGEG